MKRQKRTGIISMLFLGIALVLTGCGGGGGGTTPAPASDYAIGGTVSGLSGTLVLQNNGGDDLTITADGPFTFATALADGAAYAVTVLTQPAGQTCTLTNGTGTISGANVTDVAAGCYNSGSLDPTFDSSGTTPGIVVSKNAAGGTGNNDDEGDSITTAADGKILVTGKSYNGNNDDMVIWRYNADGTLDTGFGINGIVVSDINGNNTWGKSITTAADGKILVTGDISNGSNDNMVIWRYNSNGTPDTGFGTNSTGFVVSNYPGGDKGNSITTAADGKILVTGSIYNGFDFDMVIWRYNKNGTLDTNFGTNGIVVSDNALGGDDSGNSITTAADGKILVTGYSYIATDNDMVIWRYNADGTLDTTFNNSGTMPGIVESDNAAGGTGNIDDVGDSITTAADGKILVTGYSYNGSNNDMVIWRYNADGTTDGTFNGTMPGIVVSKNVAGGTGNDYGFSITTDSNGKILVTGYSTNSSDKVVMVIWRYNADGMLDTTFNNSGFVMSNKAAGGTSSNNYDRGNSITTDADGNILVTGKSYNGTDYDMVIWRYIP